MDRIQRALDLSRAQWPPEAPQAEPRGEPRVERAERAAFSREFSIAPIEFAERLQVDWAALRERRVIPPDTNDPAGHAYRMLRTQVLQKARAHGLHTVGVVSPVNGEGKTLTAINLALSIAAEPNQSVLLLDFDFRRPAIARLLGLQAPRGLETWFRSDTPVRSVCYTVEGVERFYVLPTLEPIAGSSDVLADIGTRQLLTELKDRDPGRLLILDLPPVLLSDDTLAVAPLLDAVVLVVQERASRREDIKRSLELLANTKVIGTVLNQASESETRAY